MALPEDFLQELKYRNDIESVISPTVALKRRGRNLVGLCPFHSEKTPSFTVYPENGSFYCFGCGAGGDVVSFVMRHENLSYIEAVRHLADRAGLKMPEDGVDDRTHESRLKILEINRALARHYHNNLMSDKGAAARDYLERRGLPPGIIRRFGLGLALDSWDDAYLHLKGQGYYEDELLAAAVVAKSRKNTCYDQFRNRIIFPIIDVRGNVVAFGGRDLGERGPKYLNSADTLVYKKTRQLYALNFAKSTKERRMLLVEGYMDVIAVHAAGFTNCVATLGTALTADQARILTQYVPEVVLCYDADEAGQKATQRASKVLDDAGLKARVLTIDGAKDPDEYIKKYGAKRFELLINETQNAVEYELWRLKHKYDIATDDGRVGYLKEAADLLSASHNPVERDVYTGRLAEELSVSKSAIKEQIEAAQRRRKRRDDRRQARNLSVQADIKGLKLNDSERRANLRSAIAEERLLAIMLTSPAFIDDILAEIDESIFRVTFNRNIFAILKDRHLARRTTDVTILAGLLDEESLSRVMGIIVQGREINPSKREVMECIGTMRNALRDESADTSAMSRDELLRLQRELANRKKSAEE